MIELRSDTFTLPTGRMREAMSAAPLGDDVYGEDPTVAELERLAAHTLGKQAACLMPSGTMANLAALMAHAPRGAKVLVGDESDIYVYEAGGASVCGGLVYEPIRTRPDGTLPLEDLARPFQEDREDPQFAWPAVICLENTHNRCGGKVLPPSYVAEVGRFAREHEVALHVDGARIFNAAVALSRPVGELVRDADSVQFCLSKGLSAPIGSMLVGSAEFITRARRIRKMLGGGMRQAGTIAAAGIIGIEEAGRLAEDHARARRLASGLAEIPGVDVRPAEIETNIVMFRTEGLSPAEFIAAAAAKGLSIAELGHGRIRAVVHRGVDDAGIDEAIAITAAIMSHRHALV
jgi:threonine aldolase